MVKNVDQICIAFVTNAIRQVALSILVGCKYLGFLHAVELMVVKQN